MDYIFSTRRNYDQANIKYDHNSIYADDGSSEELGDYDKQFYTNIRTSVIYFTMIFIFYAIAYSLVSYFSKIRDDGLDNEERLTYKISKIICAFTLAISIAAFLLLPFSIVTNEISWIDDNDTKWSLLHGMWNYVFLFSSLSLFILLPFAYFFAESEGFAGLKRGISARLCETLVLIMIVGIIVLGCMCTVCLGLNYYLYDTRFNWRSLGSLIFLYSCISFIGTLLLLLCTPLGISHLITVLKDIDANRKTRKFYVALILLYSLACLSIVLVLNNTIQLLTGSRPLPSSSFSSNGLAQINPNIKDTQDKEEKSFFSFNFLWSLGFGSSESDDTKMTTAQQKHETDQNRLIAESIKNGPFGALLEIVMILYLWSASICGLYNLPGFCQLLPKFRSTSFNQIIGNSTILCLMSSALPLLSRTLGMTNFDLLADFGRIEWLGNFYIVLLYNFIFFISTLLCLMGKREFVVTIRAFKVVINTFHKRTHRSKSKDEPLDESTPNHNNYSLNDSDNHQEQEKQSLLKRQEKEESRTDHLHHEPGHEPLNGVPDLDTDDHEHMD